MAQVLPEWTDGARRGDDAAWSRIHAALAAPLRAYLGSILGSRDRADDALQETFLRAATSIGRFNAGAPFSPWIHRIARNVALDALRARGRRPEVPLSADPAMSGGDGPSAAAESADDLRAVGRALDLLGGTDREILTLRLVSGLPPGEVARLLGIPEGTVGSRLHGALSRLRDGLAGRDPDAESGGNR